MLGYRGYGKSTGTPTEAGLKLDAQVTNGNENFELKIINFNIFI